jgi:hypothetical protein
VLTITIVILRQVAHSKYGANSEDHDDVMTMAMIKYSDLEKKKENVTPIFKDKNRMHKILMCAPGHDRTHK